MNITKRADYLIFRMQFIYLYILINSNMCIRIQLINSLIIVQQIQRTSSLGERRGFHAAFCHYNIILRKQHFLHQTAISNLRIFCSGTNTSLMLLHFQSNHAKYNHSQTVLLILCCTYLLCREGLQMQLISEQFKRVRLQGRNSELHKRG